MNGNIFFTMIAIKGTFAVIRSREIFPSLFRINFPWNNKVIDKNIDKSIFKRIWEICFSQCMANFRLERVKYDPVPFYISF